MKCCEYGARLADSGLENARLAVFEHDVMHTLLNRCHTGIMMQYHRRHDTQHNDTKHNIKKHNGKSLLF
jgi:hypothetical protein